MNEIPRLLQCAAAAALLMAGMPAMAAGAQWKLLRAPAGEFVMRYPGTYKLTIPKGEGCSNGTCRSLEEAILTAPAGSMTIVIQRSINPNELSAGKWYESLVHRALDPSMERLVTVAGREGVRRGPLAPGATVRWVNGKEVSRTAGLRPDDTLFLPLNGTDVLTIVIRAQSPNAAAAFEQIVDSMTIGK